MYRITTITRYKKIYLPGQHVKLLEGYHKDKIAKIKSFDGYRYVVKLEGELLEIKVSEEKVKPLSLEEIGRKNIEVNLPDGSQATLKDKNLKHTSVCLRNNSSFIGLYAMGKYYAKHEYPQMFKMDYFTNQILEIKKYNQSAAKKIAEYYLDFIKKSPNLSKIINEVDYACFMPTYKPRNHVELWGSQICNALKIPEISKIIKIPRWKIKFLKNYKRQYADDRIKTVRGAFGIKKNNINLRRKSCLILDDVCTTGLQIDALSDTLVEVGVREVYAFVIGRAKY